MGFAGGTALRGGADYHLLHSFWALEHGCLSHGLSAPVPGGSSGWRDAGLLPEPPDLNHAAPGRANCLHSGFAGCSANDDHGRTAWMDWFVGGEVDCESMNIIRNRL